MDVAFAASTRYSQLNAEESLRFLLDENDVSTCDFRSPFSYVQGLRTLVLAALLNTFHRLAQSEVSLRFINEKVDRVVVQQRRM